VPVPAFLTTQRRVEFADTDVAGIAHFASFFRYMEAAEHALLRSRGLSVMMDWEGRRISFPRVAASCDYLRPAHFEDVLDVTARVARVGTKSVRYEFEFHRGGELLARGQLTAVCCHVLPGGKGMEGMEVPSRIRRLLEADGEGGAL
jgi:4-hydroxybenzoyl-CoA thioesterase/acyl-CoA thioester hydrolase